MNKLLMMLIFMIGFYGVYYIFKPESANKIEKQANTEDLGEYQDMMKKYNKHYSDDNSVEDTKK